MLFDFCKSLIRKLQKFLYPGGFFILVAFVSWWSVYPNPLFSFSLSFPLSLHPFHSLYPLHPSTLSSLFSTPLHLATSFSLSISPPPLPSTPSSSFHPSTPTTSSIFSVLLTMATNSSSNKIL